MPLYPIPAHDPPRSLSDLVRHSRALSPWPGLLTTVALGLTATALAVFVPPSAWTYGLLVGLAGPALLLVRGWAGPLRRRRAWLLEIAERAALGHFAFAASPAAPALSVDELVDLVLRMEGTARFLLRPGERGWLRATTALLIAAQGTPR